MNIETQRKVQTVRDQLAGAFLEREQEVEILMLALLAGEHACLLGMAGTGKSEMLRKLASVLGMTGDDYFEIVMNKFTTPEQFLGPFSYQGVVQDKYERNTARRLPRAKVAFMDEVFKSGAALNTLLPIMCEGTFENGNGVEKIPLRLLVSASNELPEDESLAALLDRFALRWWVKPIQDRDNRRKLFQIASKSGRRAGAVGEVTARLSEAEWDEAMTDVMSVALCEDVAESLLSFREQLEREGIEYADRRWVKIVRVLQAKAYLEGDTEIDELHFAALTPALWSERDHIATVQRVAEAAVNPLLKECRDYYAKGSAEAWRLVESGDRQAMFAAPTILKKAKEKIVARRDAATGKTAQRIDALVVEMRGEFERLRETVKRKHAESMADKF